MSAKSRKQGLRPSSRKLQPRLWPDGLPGETGKGKERHMSREVAIRELLGLRTKLEKQEKSAMSQADSICAVNAVHGSYLGIKTTLDSTIARLRRSTG